MSAKRLDRRSCPYLSPDVSGYIGRLSIPAAYCRLPDGAVRVPTQEQIVGLCCGGGHHNCPGFLQRTRSAAGLPRMFP
jgi:hypothetical protein